MQKYHLAQYNIIRLTHGIDAPEVKEFKDSLEPINMLAEKSEGFVWRLKGEDGADATSVDTPYADPLVFINMSVWEDYKTLKNYTFQTAHSYFLKNRKKWSNKMAGYQAVMWWIPAGELPTVEMGKKKLDLLNENGSTPQAFSMKEVYDEDGRLV